MKRCAVIFVLASILITKIGITQIQAQSGSFVPLNFNAGAFQKEPIGVASRRTGLVISEIMYHPAPEATTNSLEYIELYNSEMWAVSLAGYRLSGEVDYLFPANAVIASRGYLVIAKDPTVIAQRYAIANVIGGYTNSLSNSSGTIHLRHPSGAILIEAHYASNPPWPAAADGVGHSLVLARPSYGQTDSRAWSSSEGMGGSPGKPEPTINDPCRPIVINELLVQADTNQPAFVEFYNYSASVVDISGCTLAARSSTNAFTVPENTTIPALGFVHYTSAQLPFSLPPEGDILVLYNAQKSRAIDTVQFGPQGQGIAYGRFPDAARGFQRLLQSTPGNTNAIPLVSDVVINEIMFHPISGNPDDEYVELYNRGTTEVDLSKWRFVDGIDYRFPNGSRLAAGGFLVVAKNAGHLMTNYAQLNGNNTLGDFQGNLANSGEHLALAKPEWVLTTNNQIIDSNRVYVVVNEVTYGDGGRWGRWADGGGSSLELIDPRGNHSLAPNWADSDETQKSDWVTVEYRGVLDQGVSAFNADSLHLFLEGEGECLVENVEVIGSTGNNLVLNGDFNNTSVALDAMGTHDYATIDPNGGLYNSSCLHLRATGRGDTGANRVRLPLSSTLSQGSTATLRAKVRWLKGNPEILLRLHGNWLEAGGYILSNTRLGTPGAPNTRRVNNAGPAITQVRHFPVLPAANEAVTVLAQIADPDGLGSATLYYRVDPNSSYASIPMVYRGAGYYSAIIPGQAANTTVAFYLQAKDQGAPVATAQFPADAPARECLVMFGQSQPSNTFPTYRIWITQLTNNRWGYREPTSNDPMDATFAYGNIRAIYNAQTQYKGSPFIVPSYNGPMGNLCGYAVDFPPDDPLFGVTDFVLDYFPRDGSRIREQIANWIIEELGAPFSRRSYVNLFVNNVKRGDVYEDAQQPNTDYLASWFPDEADGNLYKLDDGFEFNDATTNFQRDNGDTAATIENFTTTGGVKKTARYRWHWRKRAANGSANDYQDLFDLVDAANAPATNYTSRVESLFDVDQCFRVFCGERIAGNWDSYGYRRGKNMFAYKPVHGLWKMLPWDIDFVLGSGDGTTRDFFDASDPKITTMYNHPPFKRRYYQILQEAADGPLLDANISPVIDAHYLALVNNGIPVGDDRAGLKSWINQRRDYILSLLAAVASNFGITSNNGQDFSTSQNLITLEGFAPLEVYAIEINGVRQVVTWKTVTQWQIRYTLLPGVNDLFVLGFDRNGGILSTATANVSVTYTGPSQSPAGRVVINEIMYRQGTPNAEYLEILNTSTNLAFDLSSWRLNGADFTFPDGSFIRPQEYLLLAKDRAVFASVYGANLPVYGEFSGNLDNGGETLTLLKPDPNDPSGLSDTIIDRVRYDNDPPWPTEADGGGYSLQLVDPAQDHNRVANWKVGSRTSAITNQGPRWQYVTATGTASANLLYIYLTSPGEVYLDDLQIVPGSVAGDGDNQITNGDFEQDLAGTWTVSANHAASAITSSVKHSGNSCLHVIASSGGSTQGSAIWQNPLAMTSGATFTLSFWYLPGTNTTSLTIRLSGNGISQVVAIAPEGQTTSQDYEWGTPGVANSVRATLPAIPNLYVNEVQPENLDGATNGLGSPAPWIELYNAGTTRFNLGGCYLSASLSILNQWAFPADTWIEPKAFLLVWTDSQSALSTPAELHTSFTLDPGTGSVVLSQQYGQDIRIIDFLNYRNINLDRSYGAYPEGQPFSRQVFHYPTPGDSNNAAIAPIQVVINEWMANNTHSLADPVDDLFHDWIELYNAGTNSADLTGYTLTDNLTNKTFWTFPAGTLMPPLGYLLVWADGVPSHYQATNNSDQHASFQLNQDQDAIGLFAPDGSLVDAVQWTNAQAANLSTGRWPDGHIAVLPNPTPRDANVVSLPTNNPPVLPPIDPRSVNEGEPLTFDVVATDPDLPAQTLTLTLGTNAPPGAILTTNGQFSWTPTEDQGPGIFLIDVVVTDNGTPPLSATNQFMLTVQELNQPPRLDPTPNQSIRLGQSLSFTNQAVDPDWPPNTLTYHLEEDAPDGALLDATSGVFAWTPIPGQEGRSYTLTVTVVDNGQPLLSDSQAVTVTVLGPPTSPRFTDAGWDSPGQMRLRWESEIGARYRVEYKNNLTDSTWNDLGSDVTATDLTAVVWDAQATNIQRFYRILHLYNP